MGRKGLIKDLANVKENRFSSFIELEEMSGLHGNYLHLMSLINAIPQHWRTTLTYQEINQEEVYVFELRPYHRKDKTMFEDIISA